MLVMSALFMPIHEVFHVSKMIHKFKLALKIKRNTIVTETRAVLRLVWPFDGIVQNTYIRD